MNRIDRLAAIVIQLQSRRLVKAQDIADKFSIGLRTVYRDIHTLTEAGVPVIGEAGIGYRLMEGYKLPPVMFNQEEASALLTAAKLMQSMSDGHSARHYASALDKIKAVLRLAEKDHIEEIDDHIAVVRHPTFVHEKPFELHLPQLLKAIASANVIEINYTSVEKKESLHRKLEPVGIYYQGSHWYLIAFCLLRNDYRNFRTDKISKLVLTDEKMRQTHPPLQSFINKVATQKQLQKIVIDVERGIVKYFGEQKYYNGFVKEEEAGDYVRMTFLTCSLTGFARWFMLFGERAIIVEPLELNDMVAAIAENILKAGTACYAADIGLSQVGCCFVLTKQTTMTFIEFFKQQFVEEGATTRNMLSRIPDNQLDYKPHEKSMDMKRLAQHIADLPGWIHMTFTTDEIDFAQPYEQPEINSTADLMAYFEKRYEAGLSTLVPENETVLDKPWTLRNGDTIYSTDPKIDIIRMSFSQQIHHRAQLGVYLRLLNIPIPGSYGPSADENSFG